MMIKIVVSRKGVEIQLAMHEIEDANIRNVV